MAIYLVLLAQLVFLVLFSLGQQWLGVNEKILQVPNRGRAVGPTERCPTCGEAACRRGSLGFWFFARSGSFNRMDSVECRTTGLQDALP